MSIFLLKDISLKGRFLLALIVALLCAVALLCTHDGADQYKAGQRRVEHPAPVQTTD